MTDKQIDKLATRLEATVPCNNHYCPKQRTSKVIMVPDTSERGALARRVLYPLLGGQEIRKKVSPVAKRISYLK